MRGAPLVGIAFHLRNKVTMRVLIYDNRVVIHEKSLRRHGSRVLVLALNILAPFLSWYIVTLVWVSQFGTDWQHFEHCLPPGSFKSISRALPVFGYCTSHTENATAVLSLYII